MDIYRFTLTVAEPIDDDMANRLFEAGGDDAVVESGPTAHQVSFDREAPTALEAVMSAVEQLDAVGLTVLRIVPDELVSAADIAERTGRSRQSVSALIAGRRGPGNFPAPLAGNVRSPLWRWFDVQVWFESFNGSQHPDREMAEVLAAVNDTLAARRALDRLTKKDRRRVAALVR